MKRSILLTALAVLTVCASTSLGAIRIVRTGATYSTLQSAVGSTIAGDTIQIDSGTYTGSNVVCTSISTNNLTIQGVGPTRPILDAAGGNYGDKGILVVYASNITVDNLELMGTVGPSLNDAGIRYQPPTTGAAKLIVKNCYIHDNQDGVLTNGGNNISIVFDSTEFSHNGAGDGQSHNMYINQAGSFTMQYCYSHDAYMGHEVKTRANTNYILYNLISNENGYGSRNIQLAQGGTAYVIGNIVQKGPNCTNPELITYGGEGNNSNPYLYVANNTLINYRGNVGYFLVMSNSTQVAGVNHAYLTNNIIQWRNSGDAVTSGSYASQVVDTTNWKTTDALLVNIAAHDYHLTAAATSAINAGTAQGTGYGYDAAKGLFVNYPLTPIYQYVNTCNYESRPTNGTIDIGAYEYVVPNQPPTVNAGVDQNVYEGAAVSLHATASDPNNDPLTYAWTQPAGLNVTLSGAATADASFTAPVVSTITQASMTFTVTVSDTKAAPVSDSVNVRVWMRGDVNRDNHVDTLDLLALAGAWGSATGNGSYNVLCDLNNDGTVDVVDLLILADNWGRTLN